MQTTFLTLLGEIKPFRFGESGLVNWLLTLVIVAAVVSFVVWLVTKFAGPPVVPEWARWIIWVIVAVALLVSIFGALGITLP